MEGALVSLMGSETQKEILDLDNLGIVNYFPFSSKSVPEIFLFMETAMPRDWTMTLVHALIPFFYVFKGCVWYIFTGLFCMPKREDLWSKKKSFYFTSKALFILETIKFHIFRYLNVMM